MKKLMAGLATGLFVVCMAGAGSAIPFSDTKNFDELVIENSYSYTHQLAGLTSPPYTLLDATLELRHNGNSNNSAEVWFSYADAMPDSCRKAAAALGPPTRGRCRVMFWI